MKKIKKEEKIFWVQIKKLSEGQFSNEYSVIIQLADGKDVSLFVHRDLISQCEHCGICFIKTKLINVIVSAFKENPHIAQVLLPNEAFETQTQHAEIKMIENKFQPLPKFIDENKKMKKEKPIRITTPIHDALAGRPLYLRRIAK